MAHFNFYRPIKRAFSAAGRLYASRGGRKSSRKSGSYAPKGGRRNFWPAKGRRRVTNPARAMGYMKKRPISRTRGWSRRGSYR